MENKSPDNALVNTLNRRARIKGALESESHRGHATGSFRFKARNSLLLFFSLFFSPSTVGLFGDGINDKNEAFIA